MLDRSPVVVMTCGMACSGKSSYARQLEAQGYAWLSVDHDSWTLGYERHPLPPEVQRSIKDAQKRRLLELIAEGRDVVLEYAFASRAQRDEYRRLALGAGADVRFVFFDVPLEELLRRLAVRNAGPRTAHTVIVDPEQVERWYERFEWPEADETDFVTSPEV